MNDKLIEAFFDAPHTVLKRRLKPFTLRHAFVLSAAGNEIVAGTGDGDGPSIGDLYQAVEVCSRDSDFFFTDKQPSILRKWWWEYKCRKLDIITEFIKLQDYIEDYMAGPSVWSKDDGESKGAKCNWIISTVTSLMKHIGASEEQAWNFQPGKAMWYLVAAYESDPMINIDIMDDEEQAAIDALKAMPDTDSLTPDQ